MRSIKFVTACYIMSFVGGQNYRRVSSATIAKWVATHPARVRALISRLVKAGLLVSQDGSGGGVSIAKDPSTINLRDIYDAVEERQLINFHIDDPFSQWAGHCMVFPVLDQFKRDAEEEIRNKLAEIRLDTLYNVPACYIERGECVPLSVDGQAQSRATAPTNRRTKSRVKQTAPA